MTRFLRWVLPFRDIGWTEIGEEFTRFTVLWTRWGAVYLHRLRAPQEHPQCHDHPWSFVAILLRGGYWEYSGEWIWRCPGSVLWRAAEHRHNVVTEGVSWSIIITGPRRRKWGFVDAC